MTRARDTEARQVLRNSIDQITKSLPTSVNRFLPFLEDTEQTKQSLDVFMDFSAKDAERHVQEAIFWRRKSGACCRRSGTTKDMDGITALRSTAKETIERIRERKRQ